VKILAIDPGSKVAGYAMMTGLEPGELIECGRLKGRSAEVTDVQYSALVESWPHLAEPDLKAFWRILSISEEIERIESEFDPDVVVVEITSGKIGTGAKAGARGALTTIGLAAGFLAGRSDTRRQVIPVTERQWIGRRNPKRCRMATMATIYPQQDWAKIDKGGDARDAIALGRWAFRQRSLGTNTNHNAPS
jgi:hypothetical protein